MTDAHAGDPLNFGTQADVVGIDGVHLEVKRCETLKISQWYTQAQQDAQRLRDGRPAVVFRRSRKPWMIVLSLADFLDLAGKESRA